MDVRCDRCQTEYELDETRLTEAGVAVKCTNCGNVFKVRMRTASLPGVPPPSPPSLSPPPASGGAHRTWLVRRYDGSTLSLESLTALQRAVIERQVAPDDGVSIGGGAWHTLGSIPELASFFEVVRASRPRSASVNTEGTPTGHGPGWQDGPNAIGSVGAHGSEPAWVSRSALPDPAVTARLEQEDTQVLRRSRMGAWVGGVLAVLVVGGVIALYTVGIPGMSAPGTVSVAPVKPPDVNAPSHPAPPLEPVNAPAPVAVPTPPGPFPAVPVPAVAPVPAVPPKVEPKAAPAKAEPGVKRAAADEVPTGRGFDYYMAQGHKLLDSKPSQALALFDKAAEQDSRSPEPDSGRGLAYANMERLTEASTAFQAALHKSSEFTEAILGLAEVSSRQGNKRKAMGLYQRYLDLTPDGPDAPAARAQLDELKAESPAPTAQAAASPAPAPVARAAQPASTRAELPPPPPPPPPVVVPDTAPAAQ